jgi:hypothetical protein
MHRWRAIGAAAAAVVVGAAIAHSARQAPAAPRRGEGSRGDGWKQRGNGLVAAIRAGLLHDHPGLARDADPWLALT